MSGRGPGDVSRDAARSTPRDDGSSIVADPHLLPSLLLFIFLFKSLSLSLFVLFFSLNVHARRSNKSHKDTRNKISPKSVFLSLLRLNPQVPRLFPITWRRERAELLSYILTD